MEVRVLGPLEVVSDDGAVTRPKGHTAHLLAALIRSAGRVVSAEQLISVLWDDDPPASAKASIHVYLGKVRKLLAQPDADSLQPIETRPGGYLFHLGCAPADTDHFRALIDEARHLPHAVKSQHLTEAQVLWRGRPFEPWSDDAFFSAETHALEELCHALEEDMIDAELALGHHREQMGDIRALVQEAPLRERRWRQLMLALYRSDRRAEALRTFGQLRTTLAEELGIDPGPESQALEEAILFDDLATLSSEFKQRPIAQSTLFPDPGTSFVGRDHEIADIADLFTRHSLVTLTGPGGVGKTRMAIEFSHTAASIDASSSAYIDLSDITDSDLALTAASSALETLSSNAAATDDSSDDVETESADREVLVLDNCEQLLRSVAGIVDTIHASHPRTRILATSREPIGLPYEAVYQLGPLAVPNSWAPQDEIATAASIRLFADRAQQRTHSFSLSDANVAAVVQICRSLDGLPLALELAATALGTLSPDELAAELAESIGSLDGVRNGPKTRHQTLRASVEWSYRRLDDQSAALLRRLSVFRDGWTFDCALAAADIEDQGPGRIREGLRRLVNRSLVEFAAVEGAYRYRLLEPIRHVVHDLCREAGELETVRARHAQHFRDVAAEALSGRGDNDRSKWYLHFETERQNYRAAINWAIDRCERAYLAILLPAVSRYWFKRDHKGDEQSLTQRALDECDFIALGEASPLFMYGAQAALANGDPALAAERLDRFESMHTRRIDSVTQFYWHVRGNLIGFGYGNPNASIPRFEEAVAIGEHIGAPRTLMSLSRLGYMKARTLDRAGAHNAVRRMSEWEGDSRSWYEISIDRILGTLAFYEGDLDTATVHLRSSHDRMRSTGRLASVPPSVVHLGWALLESGQATEAMLLARATIESVAPGSGWLHAGLVSLLGRCALSIGDQDEATDLFYDCIRSSRRGPTLDTMTWGLIGLGYGLNGSKRTRTAATALVAAKTVMDKHEIILPSTEHNRFLAVLGTLTNELGQTEMAAISDRVRSAGVDATVASLRSSDG